MTQLSRMEYNYFYCITFSKTIFVLHRHHSLGLIESIFVKNKTLKDGKRDGIIEHVNVNLSYELFVQITIITSAVNSIYTSPEINVIESIR